MNTCRELVAFVIDYLEGTLPAGERTTFEKHLKDCPGCVDYLKSYRRTLTLTEDACRGAAAAAAPPPMPEELVQAILAARRKR